MKSHTQFTCYLQLQTDVHNEIELLTNDYATWTNVSVSGQGGAKKWRPGTKIIMYRKG